ncbi:MAG: RagB/SusD family nutrient uptake outer membrane protein [Cyclobacteriaceae bacterium]|nr:MAG: RagB/SusD family nutrient uptake outer membrane protein [Cyclobacteriaceae bacterium]
MKKYIYISILFIAISSCDDFLEVAPETILTQENFYKNQNDFEQAVTGIYAPLQPLYQLQWQLNELRSDNTYFIYNVGNRGGKPTEDLATFTVETNNATLQSNWQYNYQIISRANLVLAQIDNVDFENSVKQNLKGQALFLRALAYFDLVKNFGGVPIFTAPPTSYDETFKLRATKQQVYDQIILDALAAIDLLPDRTTQTTGRATSGAARVLLADIYLNLERWNDAEVILTPVLSMGYSLLGDYADIFKPANKGNSEIIFEIWYVTGTSQPLFSTFPYSFIPQTPDPAVITGVSPATPNGGGSNNIPTPDLIASYEDQVEDERFGASIAFYTGPGSMVGIPNYTNQPYIRKYLHPHAVYNQTDQNWPVYRYAEVLLMMSEALNEQNKSAEALTYINQVRDRAGLTTDITTTVQGELRNAIINERRIELAFENKRWNDLVRKNIAISVMTTFGTSVKNNPEVYYYAPGNAPPPNSFNVTSDFLLYPIPINEIIVNPQLQQNPGYN